MSYIMHSPSALLAYISHHPIATPFVCYAASRVSHRLFPILASRSPPITMLHPAWLAVMNIIRGVDSIAWAGNVDIKLQVWCDITTKINLGFTIAVPLSALCLMQRLESIASARHTTFRGNDRRRQIIEMVVCFGLPMIFMALSYVVQGHRFDITEDFGCSPAVYFSVAAMFILWIPPLVVSLASFVFSALTVRHFLRHRISFSTHLGKTQSGVNVSHYFRLMALGITDMFWSTGVNSYLGECSLQFLSHCSLPNNLDPSSQHKPIYRPILIPPISSLLFFLLLGLGREAIADYRAAWLWFRHVILRRPTKIEGPATILPSYKPRIPHPDGTSSKTPSIAVVASPNQTRLYNLPLPVSTIPDSSPHAASVSSRANSIVSDPFHFDRLAVINNLEKGVAKDDSESVMPYTGPLRSSFASDRNSRYSTNEIVGLDIASPDGPDFLVHKTGS
ncbi:hypothetical protein Clacol_003510 [Clathrus columnatus]|uniref:Pheromone receptor n=1 Tax=Clathrus columnatus TaxID=1419009 RepID=A0AAV5A747_9AGAM|nr:hypothetical protein Clacol_003510 [Clathrus columnatus]